MLFCLSLQARVLCRSSGYFWLWLLLLLLLVDLFLNISAS
jgi:hypothetical protein